jgi:hypothetical protein
MNRFVHEQNLKHLREVLARTSNDSECRRIAELIEEEENGRRPKSPDGNQLPKIHS